MLIADCSIQTVRSKTLYRLRRYVAEVRAQIGREHENLDADPHLCPRCEAFSFHSQWFYLKKKKMLFDLWKLPNVSDLFTYEKKMLRAVYLSARKDYFDQHLRGILTLLSRTFYLLRSQFGRITKCQIKLFCAAQCRRTVM